MEMPNDPNPMPELRLFPLLDKVGNFISKVLHDVHEEFDDYVHPLDREVTQHREEPKLWD